MTVTARFDAADAVAIHDADGVTVVAAPIPAVPDPEDERVLSAAELARMGVLVRDADAAAFARAHALLRRLLATASGREPAAVPLLTEPGQAPRVAGTDLGCSIAHSDGLVLVAVARGRRVGVDVEAVDPSLSTVEMAWIERELLRATPGSDGSGTSTGGHDGERRRFLRRWTRTEAVLKALGTGFGGDVDGEVDRMARSPCRVLDLDVGDRHVAALAIAVGAWNLPAAAPVISVGSSAAPRAATPVP